MLAKAYGNICTLWLGHKPIVVLYGFRAVKDGLTTNSEDVSGRLQTYLFNRFSSGKGILVSNGLIWKDQRRFGISTLRKLGMGNKGMERGIQTEAQHLVEFFRNKNGRAVDPSFPIVHAVSNVICAVVFGHRFSLQDKTFRQLMEAYNSIVAFGNSYVYYEIKIHRERHTVDEPKDFIDFYLDQMEKVKKVQKELDAVLGSSHQINYEDRKKLPYTNAVIHEIIRFSSIILITIPRQAVKDTTMLGYQVPKGTIIMANIDSTLFDPEYWETPHQFNPHHFLDKDGNFVIREAFLAFSAGHRVCLGEVMAKMELFIIFCSLLQTFKFIPPEGDKEINLNFVFGSTMKPYPYKLCAVLR
ncbi:UNVERIFIED_CONTAM: hypothetical protein H355_000687 [Colinus virginianus]|nr:hypothetical protein H355_000687 [Colinus virginianus]